jgi:GH24 family phage-related lysozyme (muramidase)
MTRIAAGHTSSTFPSFDEAHAKEDGPSVTAAPAVGADARAVCAREAEPPDPPAPDRTLGSRPNHIDVQALGADLLRWEGDKSFMYLDTRGYVTTGIGNKLGSVAAALELPWQHKETGRPATPAEIGGAFERVRGLTSKYAAKHPDGKNPFSATHYEEKSDLVLGPGAARELAAHRLETEFLPGLRAALPGFDHYPLPAQRALVDMAYTLGVNGLETKFPNMIAACKAGDFERAAEQCHRRAQSNEHRHGDERNIATRNLFLEAAQLNASLHLVTKDLRP